MNGLVVPNDQYPRAGQRITPLALYEVFDVPIADPRLRNRVPSGMRLCDLDRFVWGCLDEDECSILAEEAISHLGDHIFNLPERIRNRPVPRPPGNMRLKDLRLEIRTNNWLQSRGYAKDPQKLGNLTLLDLEVISKKSA
jgi:hypothetical protein